MYAACAPPFVASLNVRMRRNARLLARGLQVLAACDSDATPRCRRDDGRRSAPGGGRLVQARPIHSALLFDYRPGDLVKPLERVRGALVTMGGAMLTVGCRR